jgi:hypothetical protein
MVCHFLLPPSRCFDPSVKPPGSAPAPANEVPTSPHYSKFSSPHAPRPILKLFHCPSSNRSCLCDASQHTTGLILTLTTHNCNRNPTSSQRSNLKSCRRRYPSLSPYGVLTHPPQAHLRVIHTTLGSRYSLSTIIYRSGTDVMRARPICTTMGGGGGYWDGGRGGSRYGLGDEC